MSQVSLPDNNSENTHAVRVYGYTHPYISHWYLVLLMPNVMTSL